MHEFTSVLPPSLTPSCGNKQPQQSRRIYSRVHVLCHDIPSPPTTSVKLRSAKRLTHHTLEELKTLYKSTWEMPAVKRPLPLLPCTCCLSAPSVLLWKGVAVDPTGTHLPFRKATAMEIVCNFRAG